MALDVVCGMEVDEATAEWTSEYKGTTYYFCAPGCKAAFEKDSEKLRTLFNDKLDEINEVLNRTFSLPSFEEKRQYLASLRPDIQDAVVFGYFQLLEGSDNEEKPVH